MLRLITAISKSLIRDYTLRRKTMFHVMLWALIILFLGSTLFAGLLRDSPSLFIFYWFICGWLTLLGALLAVFDILAVRATSRAMQRRIEQETLRRADHPDDEDFPDQS